MKHSSRRPSLLALFLPTSNLVICMENRGVCSYTCFTQIRGALRGNEKTRDSHQGFVLHYLQTEKNE
ncbi:hypothetical protein Ae201684_014373 [Aphanomyces euteiches]|uniref:Secreted protein n=1 Tax=Aphanomyces euteiches TaxID=100861 RepID=A0A6G0WJY6_9STRA|nr:hypothetical protein Ae201684_014373 [Aphanomyces euteiches]